MISNQFQGGAIWKIFIETNQMRPCNSRQILTTNDCSSLLSLFSNFWPLASIHNIFSESLALDKPLSTWDGQWNWFYIILTDFNKMDLDKSQTWPWDDHTLPVDLRTLGPRSMGPWDCGIYSLLHSPHTTSSLLLPTPPHTSSHFLLTSLNSSKPFLPTLTPNTKT